LIRESRFCSGVRGVKSAPPANGEPDAIAVSASPNIHSEAQSEMPGRTVLSVADGTHVSVTGAATAARATPARLGTSRNAARTGSGCSCRPATVRPSRSPLARVSAAWRPSSRRPMLGLRA